MNSMTLEEAKKFQSTHLITLSKRIDELFLLIQKGKITSIDFRMLTVEANRQSKEIVHMGLFVAAKDGNPLKEPAYTKSDGNFEASFEYQKSIILYKKAQQEVIFEGWEVLDTYMNGECVRIKKDNMIISFMSIEEIDTCRCKLIINGAFPAQTQIIIKTIADLAEATQSNPLKLK
jgi:hypothetical protein